MVEIRTVNRRKNRTRNQHRENIKNIKISMEKGNQRKTPKSSFEQPQRMDKNIQKVQKYEPCRKNSKLHFAIK